MKLVFWKGALLLLCAMSVPNAHAEIEFEAVPVKAVFVNEGESQELELSEQQAEEARVVILKTSAGYVWATRKNLPMERTESGVYITYTAKSGAGYVRVLHPAMREAVRSLPLDVGGFSYMEHLVNMLGSITYFGR